VRAEIVHAFDEQATTLASEDAINQAHDGRPGQHVPDGFVPPLMGGRLAMRPVNKGVCGSVAARAADGIRRKAGLA